MDDCATDGSYEKLLEYSENLPIQIVILKTEKNAGPKNVRNLNLEDVSGEWITFIEDDWVVSNYYEKITHIMNSHNADWAV